MADEEGDLGSATLVLSTQDADYNLGIDAAQEKAKGMDKVFEETHEAIKGRFAERFEHAGLFLFSRQILGLAGLSDVARHTMGVITLGFEEVAGAAGLATGAIAPLLLAAGAGIIIFEKLAKGHKDTSDSLDELAKKQSEALGTTVGLENAMGKYQEEIGALPGSLDKLRDATIALDDVQRRHLMTTEALKMKAAQEALAANNAELASIREKSKAFDADAETMRQYGATTADFQREAKAATDRIKELEDANRKATQSFEEAKANIKAQAEGYSDAKTRLEQLADAHHKAGEAAKKQAQEETQAAREIMKFDAERVQEDIASAKAIEEARASLAARTKVLADEELAETGSVQERKAAVIKRFEDEQRHEIEQTYSRAVAKAQETGASIVQLEQQKTAALNQLSATVAAKERQNYSETTLIAIEAAHQVQSAFNSAFARTLIEHKSMAEAMRQMGKTIAEDAIASSLKAAEQFVVHEVMKKTATVASAQTQAAATAEATTAVHVQTAAVVELTAALAAATTQALALDAAMIAVAA